MCKYTDIAPSKLIHCWCSHPLNRFLRGIGASIAVYHKKKYPYTPDISDCPLDNVQLDLFRDAVADT